MNVKDEIEKYAAEVDKPALRWLFSFNHMASEWHQVAGCTFVGKFPNSVRVWKPHGNGVTLWENHLFKTVTLPKLKALLADAPCTCPDADTGIGMLPGHRDDYPKCFRNMAEALLKELPSG